MYRIIFNIGGLSITSWGVMLAIAFAIGIWIAERRAVKYGIPKRIISDLSVVLIITGIIGGRATYIFENMSYYIKYPGEMFKVWEGGLIFYGGFIGALLGGIFFLRQKKVSIPKVMDIVAPSIALGLGIARIGCLLNGCCFGNPTNVSWGIVFPPDSPPRWVFDEAIHIHPTQIYSSIAGVCIFLVLLRLGRKKSYPGYQFKMFLILYSGWRFFIDFLRYYESKVYLLCKLTHNQLVSILIFLLSIILLLIRKKIAPQNKG